MGQYRGNRQRFESNSGDASPVVAPCRVGAASFPSLPRDAVVELVLDAPQSSVLTLAGIGAESLRVLLDQVEPQQFSRRVLFVDIPTSATTEDIVAGVIAQMADTARRLWPIWFTDVSFAHCRNDTLGRVAADILVCKTASEIADVSLPWLQSAAPLVLDGRLPRVSGTIAALELAQLALTISRYGLVIVADTSSAMRTNCNSAAMVHALEWIAQHSNGAVIALFTGLPTNVPPFDRILYRAHLMAAELGAETARDQMRPPEREPWIAPWRGLPHPLSQSEQRLAKALAADRELASLFCFNQFVDTVRGSRPKVDLVWAEGRLVVELDGYDSHGSRIAFMYDRHRDCELTLSGYTVLRLANDEIELDVEKAIEKIRDMVKFSRTRTTSEG
jgi:very-short-patch-repair endonuclease